MKKMGIIKITCKPMNILLLEIGCSDHSKQRQTLKVYTTKLVCRQEPHVPGLKNNYYYCQQPYGGRERRYEKKCEIKM